MIFLERFLSFEEDRSEEKKSPPKKLKGKINYR